MPSSWGRWRSKTLPSRWASGGEVHASCRWSGCVRGGKASIQTQYVSRCIYLLWNTASRKPFTTYVSIPTPCCSLLIWLPRNTWQTLFQKRAWETRRGDWRRLRHDRALVCFRTDLGAPNFTNPPQRVALFREFKEGQTLRHGRRVALLRDLCGRRPVDAAAARPDGTIADVEQKVRGRSIAVSAGKQF